MNLPDGTFVPGLLVFPANVEEHMRIMVQHGPRSKEEDEYWEKHKADPVFRRVSTGNRIIYDVLLHSKKAA